MRKDKLWKKCFCGVAIEGKFPDGDNLGLMVHQIVVEMNGNVSMDNIRLFQTEVTALRHEKHLTVCKSWWISIGSLFAFSMYQNFHLPVKKKLKFMRITSILELHWTICVVFAL